MNYKLNRPVKIGKARIIIQSQLFWLGPSPDGVIFDKINQEMGLLEINVLTTRDISLLKVLLLTKHFILLLTKKKKNLFEEGTSLWLLHPNSCCNGTGWIKMVSLCCLRIQRNNHCEN